MALEGSDKLSGVQRAAILLVALGEQEAAEIMRRLEPKEVQTLGKAMASLPNLSRTQVGMVLTEFVQEVQAGSSIGADGNDYVRKVLTRALGEDKASGVLDRILGSDPKGLEPLKWMEPSAVAHLIRVEHPQVVAIVLSYLESDQAAAVLAEFPEEARGDILLRIATLDKVQPAAMQELSRIVENGFNGRPPSQSSRGGVRTAANILNILKPAPDSPVLTEIKEKDAELAQKIEDLTIVFEDLLNVDNRGIQALLREVPSHVLLLALKGADDALKEKIFSNISKRAAEMMKDDLAAKGPVRLSEVESAQKEIIKIARRMSEAGELMLGGKGNDFV
jgi:flagellar motor switch protein FliG